MDAAALARERFGLDAVATPLPGELDRNFVLHTPDGARYVLKLHHAGTDTRELDLQDAALAHLAGTPAAPRLVARDGLSRLLTWLDGRRWAEAGPPTPAALASLGREVARVDAALAGFAHPLMRRPHIWDLARATELVAVHVDPAKRSTIQAVLDRHAAAVAPRLPALPHQAIHNDANEHNVLVDATGAVSGLIDFGDIVWTARVCGLAVAAAYALQGQPDPVAAVVPLVAGYDQIAPLRLEELSVLFDLMRTRLAMSICISATRHAAAPDNDYLLISQRGVWDALQAVAGYDPDLAHFRFRDGCGYDAVPTARAVRQHLELTEAAAPLTGAVGRYGEDRDCCTAPQLALPDGRRRTLHLGIDLEAAGGTEVRAALAGVVHAATVNPLPQDYGGLVILEHATDTGVPFWTLYGHLALDLPVSPGQPVHSGDPLGRLGAEAENGGSPPHLHLQLLTSLAGADTVAPGMAPRDEADLWQSISPDPNLLLGLPDGDAARPPAATETIARRRAGVLSPALSLAYAEPLHIVRGRGAHLYDAGGRAYLDMVNNVAHVGHCHPRVVAAGQRQMAELNTNTRYLHDSVVTYARRLANTLPDPLRVVFLVNSGSEANDLALRLARAHTGRRDVLVLDHAYHGHLSSLIDISPYKFDRAGGAGRPPGTHVTPLPGAAADITVPGALAAFFAESLPGCGGQIVLPAGYLRNAYAEVRAAGGVCVADEVQVGFGRVGRHCWAFELQGVVPDIVTVGKPIGNGHPLAAVVTTPQVAASFATGMEYFNTFGGNPVSAEIGLAVLDVVRDERLQARARDLGDHLLAGLSELQRRHPVIADVRGAGLFLGVELESRRAAAAVKEAMKARGVLVSTDGPGDDVIKLKPPLVLSRDDADHCLAVLDAALTAEPSGTLSAP